MLLNILAVVLFTFGMSIDVIQKREQFYCGAQNIYHESRGESSGGQVAVANVVRNRVTSEHYPNRKAFVKAVWLNLISGMKDKTKGATHYYAHNKVDPFWAQEMEVTTVIGNHTFGYIPNGK